MAIHEIEKNVKIIDELIIYLFNKGYHLFDFNLNFKPEASIITIVIEDSNQELMETIKEDIHIERDEELEDYGWELLGESCESREIICVGMLVDKMDLSYDGKNTKIELYRSH
jgi:hypothetical protein